MSDWTAGYVADITYTYGYYAELGPGHLRQAFLHAGITPPEIGTACELGFGQGLSTAVHAAATGATWYGTDFNPAQAGFAQQLARASGSGAQLFDQAFDEFCARTDLPDFDFIGLHGIWSWISDDNRRVIVDFVRRKLKVGGVLYISYNTEAGAAMLLPLRRLMAQHSQMMSAPGTPMADKVDRALEFAGRVMAADPISARANPQLAHRFNSIKEQNRRYLAHEYFNQNWDPMAFSTMAQWLEPAKLSYACSAHLLDHIGPLNLTQAQMALLAETPDPSMRESLRDFLVHQTFRRDYWVRGARPLAPAERLETLGRQRVMLVRARAAISLKVKAALGEANMNQAVYDTVLDVLADYRPHSVAQLEQQLSGKGVDLRALVESIAILAGKGDLALVQDDAAIEQARPRCTRLNSWLLDKARSSEDIQFLASPVTGSAVHLNRHEQLFLLARLHGKTTLAEQAAVVAHVLRSEGRRLLKDGQPVDDLQETLDMLSQQASAFEQRIPVLTALGIAA